MQLSKATFKSNTAYLKTNQLQSGTTVGINIWGFFFFFHKPLSLFLFLYLKRGVGGLHWYQLVPPNSDNWFNWFSVHRQRERQHTSSVRPHHFSCLGCVTGNFTRPCIFAHPSTGDPRDRPAADVWAHIHLFLSSIQWLSPPGASLGWCSRKSGRSWRPFWKRFISLFYLLFIYYICFTFLILLADCWFWSALCRSSAVHIKLWCNSNFVLDNDGTSCYICPVTAHLIRSLCYLCQVCSLSLSHKHTRTHDSARAHTDYK